MTRRISIRALLAEGDMAAARALLRDAIFQSAPSLRRATSNLGDVYSVRRGFQSAPSLRRAT